MHFCAYFCAYFFSLFSSLEIYFISLKSILILVTNAACMYALTSVLARELWRVQLSLPRKPDRKQYESFYRQAQKAIISNVDFAVVSCLVLAGPGFAPENFLAFCVSPVEGLLQKNRSSIVLAHCSGAYRHCLEELLADPAIKGKMADTKAAQHAKALDAFYKRMQADPDRTCYGEIPVAQAVHEGAVEELMVTDRLFRSANATERRKFVGLVEIVKKGGGKVVVFSEQHVTGQQLGQLGGIAAMLRYAIEEQD